MGGVLLYSIITSTTIKLDNICRNFNKGAYILTFYKY